MKRQSGWAGLRKPGVHQIGAAPTIKCGRYGFNKPAARSVEKMGVCGQRAVLGFNLGKLVRGLAERQQIAVAW